jgi:hypothetical protein
MDMVEDLMLATRAEMEDVVEMEAEAAETDRG